MKLMKRKMRSVIILSLFSIFTVIQAKRHSRRSKILHYEQRAREAAEANSPLASALTKQTKNMTFDEAVLAQDYYRKADQQDMVIKCGERLLAVGGNQEIMRLTRLELAEQFLKKGNYTNAEKHAQDYLLYYPGSQESKKASLIALNATYKSQNNSYRDQQKTHATIRLAKDYRDKYPDDTDHKQEVQEILQQSYLKLIRSELSIIGTQHKIYTYANGRGSLPAAQKRLASLKKDYLPHAPSAQKRVLQVEQALNKAAQENTVSLAQADERTRWERVSDFFSEDNRRYFA